MIARCVINKITSTAAHYLYTIQSTSIEWGCYCYCSLLGNQGVLWLV